MLATELKTSEKVKQEVITNLDLNVKLTPRIQTRTETRLEQKLGLKTKTAIAMLGLEAPIRKKRLKKRGQQPRKRYVPDLTAYAFGITRKGKAPKSVSGFEVQPIYINRSNVKRNMKRFF